MHKTEKNICLPIERLKKSQDYMYNVTEETKSDYQSPTPKKQYGFSSFKNQKATHGF